MSKIFLSVKDSLTRTKIVKFFNGPISEFENCFKVKGTTIEVVAADLKKSELVKLVTLELDILNLTADVDYMLLLTL